MFALRRRPKGLEVPACEPCNSATRQHEQVAALIARAYPDGKSANERVELAQIMKSVSNNFPGILEDMNLFRDLPPQITPASRGGLLDCSGPIIKQCVQKFGAKLGFALHYATTGHAIPNSGGVSVLWFTNYDAVTGGLPENALHFLGSPQTLRQGSWVASDQFNYSFAIEIENDAAVYLAVFRMSFAILCYVNERSELFRDDLLVHRPGQF